MLSTAACHTVFLADLSHLIFEEATVACQTDQPITGNVNIREMFVSLTGTGPIDPVIPYTKDHLSALTRDSYQEVQSHQLSGPKILTAIDRHLTGEPSIHWVVCPRTTDMVP